MANELFVTVTYGDQTVEDWFDLNPAYADMDEDQAVKGFRRLLRDLRQGQQRGDHLTVFLEIGDRQADIDVEMAPLIAACWRADINTEYCCQADDDDRAYISFGSQDDAERFLTLVVPSDVGFLSRVLDYTDDDTTWMYMTRLQSTGSDEKPFRLVTSIHFPRTDIQTILKHL